ncbi:FtsX-like permease family protein [Krasilnikovia sp. M28-CT-15]|uniref:FtsX-like permease family protein n=1 Tax=Krasilnikovia sp. M28-CT-15 TaxID=3373540 RepID=UPI00387717CF
MTAGAGRPRIGRAGWGTELALGMRMCVAGGRSGWAQLTMIALGVGLGVAMLLTATTIPAVMAARDARINARAEDSGRELPRGADTVLVARADSQFGEHVIHGRMLQPEGDRAPLPPGVTRRLAPGEMVVSPALATLLASPDAALLRDRWGARVVGRIGPSGLAGPAEYAFYLGAGQLDDASATRVRTFGAADAEQGLPPELLLLGSIGLVVLLLPVAIFVMTAVRFGSEARDRRLAAVRLVGADAAMTSRIAAGESLAGAIAGLLVGGLVFLAVARLAGRLVPERLTFYDTDVRPVPALVVLVAVLVPVATVLVTLSALRRVVVEPLGVVRRGGDRRRRLWWRLILPATGVALLWPVYDGLIDTSNSAGYQVVAGVTALLTGLALLLPWLVEATVRRLGAGGISWQLAVRRLQLDNGTAVRAVSGIAVSVAGAIALQGLFAAVQAQYAREDLGRGERFQIVVLTRDGAHRDDWVTALRHTTGVRVVEPVTVTSAVPAVGPDQLSESPDQLSESPDQLSESRVQIGGCDVLRRFGRIGACADGDTFLVAAHLPVAPHPGTTLVLGDGAPPGAGKSPRWTLPATTRTVPAVDESDVVGLPMILATPAAVRGSLPDDRVVDIYAGLDPAVPDALDRLRNTAARRDPTAIVLRTDNRSLQSTLATIRQALLVGAVALLVLIGASMLVNVAEQLRERRKLMAVLVAFGTRQSTLTGSVFYQVAIPVLLGLSLAVIAGTGLSAALQTAAGSQVRIDWLGIGITSMAAALVVVLTTVASLPLQWRLTRPVLLRSE